MKKRTHAYVVIDVDGTVCWGLLSRDKREASMWARNPKRRVARVEVVKIVRKTHKRKP